MFNIIKYLGFNHSLPINNYSILWFVSLPLFFLYAINYFKSHNLFLEKTKNGNNLYISISIYIPQTICVIYLSLSSLLLIYYYHPLLNCYDHIFERNTVIENHILIPMFFYQFWNTVVVLFNKDFFSIFILAHHLFVLLLCYYTFSPFMQYLTVFFFGLVEISNIFLSWIEITEVLPFLKKKYILIDKLFSLLFVLTYYLFRIILWIYISVYFFYNIGRLVVNEFFNNNKLEYIFLTIVLVISYIFLSFLQFFWAGIILKNITNKKID